MAELKIDLPVLELVKDLQMQHGLKYENYQNYHSYCSRRLHRIRRSLNVYQGEKPSVKARHQRARKLMDVTNPMVLEAAVDKDKDCAERILIIPLCLAERAWAHAMQLKQEIADYPRKRFYLVRRLRKAAKYATKFDSVCNEPDSPCSQRTKLEATAYAAYINSLYKFEREDWAEAKNDLDIALATYFSLSLSITNEEILEHYRQRIDELRAILRYCLFNLYDKSGDAKDNKDRKKVINVRLPPLLQFHDLAFRHIKKAQTTNSDHE